MIETFEIMSILFFILMIYLTFLAYRRGQFTKIHLIFWYGIWIIGIIAIIISNRLNKFLISLNIARVFDLYALLGFIFLLFMVFHLFRVVKNNEKRLENLTREIALKPLKNYENSNFSRLD